MDSTITRRSHHAGASVLEAGASATPVIDVRGMAGGVFQIPSDWDGGASVSFEASHDPLEGSAFGAVHGAGDALITQSVTPGKWYAFPEPVLCAAAAKIVPATPTLANRTLRYHLKA